MSRNFLEVGLHKLIGFRSVRLNFTALQDIHGEVGLRDSLTGKPAEICRPCAPGSAKYKRLFRCQMRDRVGFDQHLLAPAAREHIGEADVRVKDFAGERVCARWSLCEASIHSHKPPNGVVAGLRCVPVSIVGLLFHFDRVPEADLLERLIPHEYAFANGGTVVHWNGVLEPENNWLLRTG